MTTFGIGGPARYFVRAKSDNDVIAAFEYAGENSLDVFVLGGGSNLLVSDAGFDGLVVQVALKGIGFEDTDGKVNVTAQAGENWDSLVEFCVEENLAGFECLSGIPGFVGGTPVQNVGAYGQEVSETIVSVRCFDRKNYRVVDLSNVECGFSYRTSVFNTTERNRYVVLSVEYSLTKNGEPKIVYKDLTEHFCGRTPTLAEARQVVLKIRGAKSMVIDAADPNSRSAGSFFKNPIVAKGKAAEIERTMQIERVPQFPVDENTVKIPAAWLIENAGFRKGYRKGNAGISENHSLALVNFGGATAADIIALKDEIQASIWTKFGIELEPEPIFIGVSNSV